MDNQQPGLSAPVPKHIEVQNKQDKQAIPDKKFVIFYSDPQTPEGSEGKYMVVSGVEEVLLAQMELKKNGAIKIAVYKQVEIKVSLT